MLFFQAKVNPTMKENQCGLTHAVKGCKCESLYFSPCADMHHGEGHWNGSRAAPDGPLGSHWSRSDNISDIKQIWLTWTQQVHVQHFCALTIFSFKFSLKKTFLQDMEDFFRAPFLMSLSDYSIIYYTSFYLDFYLVVWPQGEKKSSKSYSKKESNGCELSS